MLSVFSSWISSGRLDFDVRCMPVGISQPPLAHSQASRMRLKIDHKRSKSHYKQEGKRPWLWPAGQNILTFPPSSSVAFLRLENADCACTRSACFGTEQVLGECANNKQLLASDTKTAADLVPGCYSHVQVLNRYTDSHPRLSILYTWWVFHESFSDIHFLQTRPCWCPFPSCEPVFLGPIYGDISEGAEKSAIQMETDQVMMDVWLNLDCNTSRRRDESERGTEVQSTSSLQRTVPVSLTDWTNTFITSRANFTCYWTSLYQCYSSQSRPSPCSQNILWFV